MDRSFITELKNKTNLTVLPRPVVVGLAAVLLIIVFLAAGRVLSGSPQARIALEPTFTNTHTQEAGDEAAYGSIFVHVSGAVEKPGLVELKADARVAEAIEAAGGFKSEADTASVNLARILDDGEQLYVGTLLTDIVASTGSNGAVAQGRDEGTVVQPSIGSAASGKVNINTATQGQLTALPGIGDSTAIKIVNDRTKNGPFKKIEDITRVSGIGDKKFEALRDLICV